MEGNCALCRRWAHLDRHHVFPGTANRKKSEEYGAVIYICRSCHTGKDGIQHNRELADYVKSIWQSKLMRRHGWTKEVFIQKFGKNYIKEDTNA